MMRQEYIAGLEEIRKRMIEIGQAFAAVDLTDATGMERDRRKKMAKLVGDLADRLYEDIAISAKVAADKAEAGQGEQDDLFAAANREKAKGAKAAACRRFQTEMGNSQKVAVRRGVLTLIRSLRARTLEAPKKSRAREFKVSRYTGDGPRYVTNPRSGTKATHGKSNGLVIHRWTPTRRLGTPQENTHHYYAYAHLRHNKRGEIVKDFAAERREVAFYHTGIKWRGLARKSWGWFMQKFFGNSQEDKNPKAKIRPDMVDGHFETRKNGDVEMVDVLIHNKLNYIADAMKPGALEEAMRVATRTINERIDNGFAKARKELT